MEGGFWNVDVPVIELFTFTDIKEQLSETEPQRRQKTLNRIFTHVKTKTWVNPTDSPVRVFLLVQFCLNSLQSCFQTSTGLIQSLLSHHSPAGGLWDMVRSQHTHLSPHCVQRGTLWGRNWSWSGSWSWISGPVSRRGRRAEGHTLNHTDSHAWRDWWRESSCWGDNSRSN